MRGSEGKGEIAGKDAWAAALGPFPESGVTEGEVFGVGSRELVDLGHAWVEVLPARVSSRQARLCVGGGDADAGSIMGGGLAVPISGRVCRARRVQAGKRPAEQKYLTTRRKERRP